MEGNPHSDGFTPWQERQAFERALEARPKGMLKVLADILVTILIGAALVLFVLFIWGLLFGPSIFTKKK